MKWDREEGNGDGIRDERGGGEDEVKTMRAYSSLTIFKIEC